MKTDTNEPKSTSQPSSGEGLGVMCCSARAIFCNQVEHYASIYVVDTNEQAKNIVTEWSAEYHGIMSYNHDTKDDEKCKIVLKREYLSFPLLVHELTHAAIEWVHNVSMPIACEHVEDLESYYTEAMARVMESLTTSAYKLI